MLLSLDKEVQYHSIKAETSIYIYVLSGNNNLFGHKIEFSS